MKVLFPGFGDYVADHLHNIYHRLLKNKETVMTTFNGVGVVFFINDDDGFERARRLKEPYKCSIDMKNVGPFYVKDVEKDDPSGYTAVKKLNDWVGDKNFAYRSKVNRITAIVSNWEHSDNPQQIKNEIKKILEE